MLTVFSTNAPHELMRSDHHTNKGDHYKFSNPFDFFACMQFGGNHATAAQAYLVELRTKQQPDIDRLMRPTNVATNEPGKPPLTVVKSEPTPDETETPSGQSYKLQNMADLIGVPYEPRVPDRLIMDNGNGLLYSNAHNLIAAAPGCLKTMLAAYTCLQQMRQGKHVVVVDFEMNIRDWFTRFIALGATDTELKLAHYCNPEESLRAYLNKSETITTAAEQTMHAEIARISELPGGLGWVVIDGIIQGMAQNNLDYINNADIATFWDLLPQKIVRLTGAGVGANDHLPKNPVGIPTPIGGIFKIGTTSGAVHTLVGNKYLSRAPILNQGIVRFYCNKDRHGLIGQHRNVAQAIFTPSSDGSIGVVIEPWTGEHDTQDQANDAKYLETIRQCNANGTKATLNLLAKIHAGNNKLVAAETIMRLVENKQIENRGNNKPKSPQNWFAIDPDTYIDPLV